MKTKLRMAIPIAFAILLMTTMAMKPASTKWFTKNGHIDFYSHTSMEDIQADNENVISVIDVEKAKIEFKVPVNAFMFKKKLMQEHFNENYLESEKFPDAKFSGTITNNADINYNVNGTYDVTCQGKLTMHGVTKDVTAKGIIIVNNQAINLKSSFNVNLDDYNISIPGAVKDKISKSIKVGINCNYKQFSN